jgi:ATP-dependent helicase/nuclease subunit A
MSLTDRQKQALDHSKSLCVTAGAGTGKTRVLVEKYVDLIENIKDLKISGILALTFTDKAASEMKQRIRDTISGKSGEKWKQVDEDFIWANISTIHSFCFRVLKDFPIETGIDPNFTVLDEIESNRILEDALDKLLQSGDPSIKDALIDLLTDANIWYIKSCLIELYKKRVIAEEVIGTLEDEKIIQNWKNIIRNKHKELVRIFFEDESNIIALNDLKHLCEKYTGSSDSGMKYLRNAEPYLNDMDSSAPVESIISAFQGLSGIKNASIRMGSSGKWDNSDLFLLRESFSTLRSFLTQAEPILEITVDDDEFHAYSLHFIKELSIVFGRYLELVDELKWQKGCIDFTDMIYETHKLFTDNYDVVSKYFTNRYRYILIDEFQDTDPVQFRIFLKILGDLSAHSEKLFVVGDPKQSIYLFRDADVTLFKQTQELIKKSLGGKIIPLDINFRSTPQIIGFVNYLFSRLLADNSKPWEFGYDLLEVSESRKKHLGSVELLLSPSDVDKHEENKKEAEMVARKIQSMIINEKKKIYWDKDEERLDVPVEAKWGDVAILLQRRNNLHYYEWALRKYAIPYHVHAGLGYFERQEVIDLFNIIKFLENELDDVALYGILRSPYFGISDTLLYKSAKSVANSLWWRIKQYTEDSKDPSFEFAIELLKNWLDHAHREPVTDLLRRIIRDSGIYAVYGSMPEGKSLIANLEKFMQIARSSQKRGFMSLSEFVCELAILIDESQREGEAQVGLEKDNNVKIMTVHASKGLEFPIVVIPDMTAKARPNNSHILINEKYGIGIKAPDPDDNYKLKDTLIKKLINHDLKDKTLSEKKRLFYVAATRAKDHLVLCSVMPKLKDKSLEDGNNWIDWAISGLDLEENDIIKGVKNIEFPPGSSTIIPVKITDDPKSITARITDEEPTLIEIPKGIDKKVNLPDELTPINVPEQEHVFTASEIGMYLDCPRTYYQVYRIGRPVRDVTVSAIGESARTEGLIIHEIFQGKDPEFTVNKYGIDDPKKAGLYAEHYQTFLYSDMMKDVIEQHKEMPFRTRINGFLFSGSIDRLVKKKDGSWIVIDYKAGRIQPDEIEDKVKQYSIQLLIYEMAASQIVGTAVRSYVYFTQINEFRKRSGDEWQILETVSNVVGKINNKVFEYPDCDTCTRQYVDNKLIGDCPGYNRSKY